MQKLLVRSRPEPDESLAGYLVRLTEENGYDTPSWIMRLAGIEYRQADKSAIAFRPPEYFEELAALTDNEVSRIGALTYPPAGILGQQDIILFEGARIYKYLLRIDAPRVCPQCLIESGYCRRAWELTLVTACPLHCRLLLEKCPRCNSGLRMNRKCVSVCSCGYDYRDSVTPSVPSDELVLARQIYSLCGFTAEEMSRTTDDPTAGLSLSDLVTLIIFISGQLRGSLSTTGRRYLTSRDTAELHDAFVKARAVFREWPHRYYEFLEWRQLHDESSRPSLKQAATGLGKSFDSFYEGIYSKMRSPSFEFMRAAFSEYVTTYWQDGYLSKAKWYGKSTHRLKPTSYVTRREARNRLGVAAAFVDQLVSRGLLKAVVRQMGKKRMFLVDADSLAQLERTYKQGGTARRRSGAAASRLG